MGIGPFRELLARAGFSSIAPRPLWERQKTGTPKWRQTKNAPKGPQIDPLSGLLQKTVFNHNVSKLLAKTKTPVGIILVKMDQFQDINDVYGYPIGDAIIRSVGGLITQISRPGSLSGRMEGVTFCIAIPNASLPAARIFAEGLRRALSELESTSLPDQHELTASFGVALHVPANRFDQSYQKACDALLNAQKKGYNKISLAMKDAA